MGKIRLIRNFLRRNARRRAGTLLEKLDVAAPARDDPQGSYTGRPADGENPQQDADDL